MIKNSFIYTGHVVHKRFKPKTHYFKYKVFSLLIDLSEIKLALDELASSSNTLNPMLCLVFKYSSPGFPNPTIKYFIITL